MIVDKSVFDNWYLENQNQVISEDVPTPMALMTLYKDNQGEILATIATPTDGSDLVYEVR